MKKFLFILTLSLLCAGMSWAQNVIYVDPEASDGDLIVYNGVTGVAYSTCKAAVAAASVGDTVRLLKNVEEAGVTSNPYGVCVAIVDRITIDGNGHSIKGTGMSGSYSSVFYFKGGTIKNFSKITGGFRTIFSGGNFTADLIIDNCVIDAGTGAYVFNTDAASHNYSVYISNCDIGGWFSYTGDFKSFTITNCTLGKGTSSYAFYRPYSPTIMQGCSFSNIYEVDPSENSILFNDCDIAGTALNSYNLSDLLGDPSDWQNQTNGSLSVVVNGDYNQNAEGEITAGIYGGNLDVLNSMCADGYRGVPIPGTDPQQYLVTPIYYIHFNSSGGTGTMESVYVPREAPNNVYTVPTCTFTNTSFSFLTWNTKPAGGGTDVAVDATMTLTSDTTLYAVWDCEAMIGTTCYGTLNEAIAAAAIGDTVKMLKDVVVAPQNISGITENLENCCIVVDRIVLDGQGHTLTASDYVNEVVFTKGGTIMNLTISGAPSSYAYKGIFCWGYNAPANLNADIILDNVTLNRVVYTLHCDGTVPQNHSVLIKNSNINGWTSFSDVFSSYTIVDCNFGGSFGYAYFRPYGSTVVQGTSFSSDYEVDPSINSILFIDCDIAGTTLNSDNLTDIYEDQSGWYYSANESQSVVVNDGYATNANGEITGGIYGGNLDVLNDMCADGYKGFALGTDPETYRVSPVYYIHYNNNGGTGTMEDSYVAQTSPSFTVPACTFTSGSYSFTGWNTKSNGTGTPLAVGDPLTLTSDTTLYAQWDYVAMIGSTGYGSLQAAADAAYGMTGNVTIDLVKDIDADYAVIRQKDNLDITIKGNNHTMNGQIFITAQGVNSNNTSVTIDNFNFNINYDTYTLQPATDAVVYIPDCRTSADPFWNPNNASSWWQQHGINIGDFNNYTRNITVRNCNFNMPTHHDTGPTLCAFKAPNSSAKANGLVLDYLTASGGHSLAQIAAPTKGSADTAVIISNCTYTERTHNGINITYGETGALIVIRNTNITTPEGYALRVKNNGPKSLYLSDNHFESIGASAEGLVFNDSEDANYYISSGWYEGPMTITAATNHVILTGGTYDRPVADVQALCAPGYMAIDADPSAGYCTVRKMNWVTFDANGGTGTMDPVYFDPRTPQTYTVPACTFTYTGGIDFLAWNTKADGTGTSFDPDNNETITITSDTVLYAQWDCVAMIGETPYATLQAAVDAARASMTGDVIVKLLKDVTAYTLVRQKEGLDLTIDGQNHFLRGQIMIDGDGRSTGTDSLIIKNVKFEYDDGGFHASTPKAFVYFVKESGLIATSGHNYAHNVLVQNCSFNGLDRITNYPTYAVFSPNGQGGIYNITLDHLTATNVFTPALMNSTTNLTITHYTADEVTEGINIPGGTGNITLDYDTISAELYALRIRDNGTRVANIDNSQFVGANSILTGNSGTLNIAGGRYDGPLGYHTGYDADNDATVYSITGGTFNEDVTKKCAAGYTAFANGTTPETWTVYPAYKVKYVANNGTDAYDSLYVRQSEGTVVIKECNYTYDGYTFLKWNKQADGSGSGVYPGVAYPLTADVTFYAQWGLNLVYNVDQDIYYASLSTAMNDANAGDTLRLLENLDLSSSVEFSQEQTLDLNTKTINSTVQYAVKATDGKVNIKNGTINSNKTYAVYCDGTAKLNIVDCNVNATQYTVVNNSTDTLTFTNGTIVNTYSSSGHYTIQNKQSGVIMVSGVTIPDGKNYLVDNVTTGTIKLNNHCNITGGDYVVRNNAAAGKIYIDNSTITGTASYAYVVYPNKGGQMYISNSKINAPAGYCVYVDGSSSTPYVDINNCTLNAERRGIQNATIGRVDIHGNTTITLNSTNQAQYGVYQSTAGTLNVGGYIDENDNLVADGTVTITINPSISGTNCGAYVSNGVLNIFGNTNINAAGQYATAGVICAGSSIANISGGTITADNACIFSGSKTTLNITGGTFNLTGDNAKGIYSANTDNKAKIAISGGTFNMAGNNANAFYLTGKDTVSVTGGTFTATGTNDILFNATGNGAVVSIDDITATASTLFNCGATDSIAVNGGTYNSDGDWLVNAGKVYLNGGIFTSDNTTSAINNGTLKVNKGWYSGNMTSNTRSTKKYIARTGSEEPTYKDDAYLVPVDADAVTAASLTGTYYQLGNTITYHRNDGADNTLEQYKPIDESVTLLAEDAFTAPVMIAYWNTLADGTGTEYAPSSASPTTNADLDLYAQWKNVYNANTGRYYNNLQPAIDAATAGDSLVVLTDMSVNATVVVNKSIIINGQKHTIDATNAVIGSTKMALAIDEINLDVKIRNLNINGGNTCKIGVQVSGEGYADNCTVVIDSCRIYNFTHYAITTKPNSNGSKFTVSNSYIQGWTALSSYGGHSTFNFYNDTLRGINRQSGGNNDLNVITLNGQSTSSYGIQQANKVDIQKCVIIAEELSTSKEFWLGFSYGAKNDTVTVDCQTKILDGPDATANNIADKIYMYEEYEYDEVIVGNAIIMPQLTDAQKANLSPYYTMVDATNGCDQTKVSLSSKYTANGAEHVMYIDFNYPFVANTIAANDKIELLEDVTMTRNDTINFTGNVKLNFSDGSVTHSITQGSYSIVLGDGATCTTDKQALELFSSLTGSNITETDNNDGTWTYSVTPYFWVTYNPNSGTGTIDDQVKPTGTDITLSDGTDGAGTYLFTKPDSTLYRWNTTPDEAAGSTNYALGATYDVDANLDLYAVWRLNLNMTMDSTDVVCYGENNGTDTVKIIGGEAPFQIVLSSTVMADNDTVKNLMDRTYIFTNLKPGKYNVQLTDVLKKDTIRGTFTIAQPDTLEITAITVPEDFPCPLMGNGSYDVSVTAQGGNGGYHYTWSEAAVNNDAAATTVVSGADDRDSIYTVKVVVTDSKNCTAEGIKTFTVSKVIADDGTVHSNSKLTIDTIRIYITTGCDTVYKEFGTPVFTTTIPGGYPEDKLVIVNNIPTAYPDSVFYLGENKVIWTATDTCGHSITGEQVIIVYHNPCPNVTDVDGNEYTSVRLGCDCWMAKNLRTSKFSDGRPISNLMKYESPTHPDAEANFAIYGYLYDWAAALDAESGVTPDADGNVQGICPTGWHLPSDIEFMRVAGNGGEYDMFELRYHGYWLDGGGNNSTDFSLLPGGCYNDNTARYENILGNAYLWSVNTADPSQPKMFWADCKCYMWQVDQTSANMGASVRCVKD